PPPRLPCQNCASMFGVERWTLSVERSKLEIAVIHEAPARASSNRGVSAENNGAPMIAVRSLVKQIGPQEILRGVDLELGRGETLAIIGRSGGGKSVLLKHLIGLMRPDAGEIWIEGQNIIDMSERNLASIRQKVGILFQGSALFDSMTVAENIA